MMIRLHRNRQLVFLVATLILVANLNCATTLRFLSEVTNNEAPTVYGGTEINILLIYGGLTVLESPLDCGGLALLAFVGGLVDLPFSLLADTLLLPITLPAYFLSREQESPQSTDEKRSGEPARKDDPQISKGENDRTTAQPTSKDNPESTDAPSDQNSQKETAVGVDSDGPQDQDSDGATAVPQEESASETDP